MPGRYDRTRQTASYRHQPHQRQRASSNVRLWGQRAPANSAEAIGLAEQQQEAIRSFLQSIAGEYMDAATATADVPGMVDAAITQFDLEPSDGDTAAIVEWLTLCANEAAMMVPQAVVSPVMVDMVPAPMMYQARPRSQAQPPTQRQPTVAELMRAKAELERRIEQARRSQRPRILKPAPTRYLTPHILPQRRSQYPDRYAEYIADKEWIVGAMEDTLARLGGSVPPEKLANEWASWSSSVPAYMLDDADIWGLFVSYANEAIANMRVARTRRTIHPHALNRGQRGVFEHVQDRPHAYPTPMETHGRWRTQYEDSPFLRTSPAQARGAYGDFDTLEEAVRYEMEYLASSRSDIATVEDLVAAYERYDPEGALGVGDAVLYAFADKIINGGGYSSYGGGSRTATQRRDTVPQPPGTPAATTDQHTQPTDVAAVADTVGTLVQDQAAGLLAEIQALTDQIAQQSALVESLNAEVGALNSATDGVDHSAEVAAAQAEATAQQGILDGMNAELAAKTTQLDALNQAATDMGTTPATAPDTTQVPDAAAGTVVGANQALRMTRSLLRRYVAPLIEQLQAGADPQQAQPMLEQLHRTEELMRQLIGTPNPTNAEQGATRRTVEPASAPVEPAHQVLVDGIIKEYRPQPAIVGQRAVVRGQGGRFLPANAATKIQTEPITEAEAARLLDDAKAGRVYQQRLVLDCVAARVRALGITNPKDVDAYKQSIINKPVPELDKELKTYQDAAARRFKSGRGVPPAPEFAAIRPPATNGHSDNNHANVNPATNGNGNSNGNSEASIPFVNGNGSTGSHVGLARELQDEQRTRRL